MPVSIQKRGCPKGQDLTVIGLPKKKKRNTVAFAKKSHHEKHNVILNFFVKDSNIVKNIINGIFLENFDLKMLPEEISHAVLDEAIDIHMIRSFCTEEAFDKIVNLVEQKRLRQRWPCSVCGEDTQKNHTGLCCRGCLLWRHIRCAGLCRRPKSKLWFCRECYL
ncbi:hypothetical protein JTB14_004904 [Gonioctena quinquepunctata]|nr:hypothetical protein JTB14_004904 [Gonioctena quinquepunctata]